MKAYKKEVKFTFWMVLAFIAFGNGFGIMFSMFPFDGVLLFGFPIRYIIPIIFGWFGVYFLTILAGRMGNRLDDEIVQEIEGTESRKEVG
ncbi:hypothetical protein HUG20_03705 [Salicibibacter cibi]|uniref:DUF3311 domain-containing protein n=1 Tax=Salicibibacter cibi TaxID=2743001 RepID=A0A7T7CEJ2_9BACI|nr:hypothetical protein [Salicibibacter cibi]QQK79094.1 hypothetical protein HUG20_03705 [Salicibibacter cibi]